MPESSRGRLHPRLGHHWPAFAVGVVGAGALVVALAVSGGSGAGAQPGPPASGSPAAASSAGTSHEQESVGRAVVTKKVKIAAQGPGAFTRARVDGPTVGAKGAPLLRYAVKVEKGLPYEADEIALAVQATLSDPRSWIGSGSWRLKLVSDPGKANFTVYLATPGTVDRYCWPLRTYGRVSCQAGNRVMLNARRWARGADAYGSDVSGYREYLVNHEVGHRLGHYHVGCPGKGRRAPVMMQQTKGIGSCKPNPWPAPHRTG